MCLNVYGESNTQKMQIFALAYISIWMLSPILANSNFAKILALTCFFLFFLGEILKKDSVMLYSPVIILAIFFYITYTSLVNVFVGEVSSIKGSIQLFVILLFIIIHESCRNSGFNNFRLLLYLTLFITPIWYITTLLGLEENSRAARAVIRSSQEAIELSNSGVGGFSLIYFSVSYLALLLPASKLVHKKWLKLLIWTNIILATLVVLKAQYSTALIILILVYSIYFFFDVKFNFISLIKLLFFCFLISLIYIFRIDFLDYLSSFLDGSNYQMKISDLKASLINEQASGTVSERTERYVRSLNIFSESPIIGGNSRVEVGKHSLILDTFAQFGFFIGVLLIYILSYPFRNMRKSRSALTVLLPVSFVAILLFTLNNVAMSYGLVTYILAFIMVDLIENES